MGWQWVLQLGIGLFPSITGTFTVTFNNFQTPIEFFLVLTQSVPDAPVKNFFLYDENLNLLYTSDLSTLFPQFPLLESPANSISLR